MLQHFSATMVVISTAASPRHATGGSSEQQEGATPAVTEGRAALATLNANGAQPPGQLEELDQTPSALQQWMYPGWFSTQCVPHPTCAGSTAPARQVTATVNPQCSRLPAIVGTGFRLLAPNDSDVRRHRQQMGSMLPALQHRGCLHLRATVPSRPHAVSADQSELEGDFSVPVWDHLEELRERVLIAGLATLAAICACFCVSKDLVVFLEAPVAEQGVRFLQLSPGEFFFTTLKVSHADTHVLHLISSGQHPVHIAAL